MARRSGTSRGDVSIDIVARDMTAAAFTSAARNATLLTKGLAGTGGAIGALSLLSAKGLAVGAAMSAIGLAFNRTVKAGAEFSRTIEDATLQFDFLARKTREVADSADFARTHMAQLVKLSRESPLDLTGVIQASTVLENFGGAVLNNERFLKRFIDTVSILRTSIGQGALGVREIGRQLGQSLTLLASGRRAGQDLRVLQQRGVLTIDARRRMERTADLVKTGAISSQEAFIRLREIIYETWEAFEGGAEAASNTLSGLEEKSAEAFKDMARQLLEVSGYTAAWKVVLSDVYDLMEDWIKQLAGTKPLESPFLKHLKATFDDIAATIMHIRVEWAGLTALFGSIEKQQEGFGFWERATSSLVPGGMARWMDWDRAGDVADMARRNETNRIFWARRRLQTRIGIATSGAPPGGADGEGDGEQPTWRRIGTLPPGFWNDPYSMLPTMGPIGRGMLGEYDDFLGRTAARGRAARLARGVLPPEGRGSPFGDVEPVPWDEIETAGDMRLHADFLKNIRATEGVLRGIDQLIAINQGGGSWWQRALAIGGLAAASIGTFGAAFGPLAAATAAKWSAVSGALTTGARIGGVPGARGQATTAARGQPQINVTSHVSLDSQDAARVVSRELIGL